MSAVLIGKLSIALLMLPLAGCEMPADNTPDETLANSVATEPNDRQSEDHSANGLSSDVVDEDGLRITKSGFADAGLIWPLSVNDALIGCEQPELLWIEANGERYGLNGMGRTHLKLDRFDDIWLFDEEMAQATGVREIRVSPNDLMNEARKLCS